MTPCLTVLNRVAQGEDAALGLRFITNIRVLQTQKSWHDEHSSKQLMFSAPRDGGGAVRVRQQKGPRGL